MVFPKNKVILLHTGFIENGSDLGLLKSVSEGPVEQKPEKGLSSLKASGKVQRVESKAQVEWLAFATQGTAPCFTER